MPIGVPRIIYCWGEELPAQWTDIYNFIFRRRMVFLMQYLDDELCNQICGLLINIHMEDRSKELEKKEIERSGVFKSSSKTTTALSSQERGIETSSTLGGDRTGMKQNASFYNKKSRSMEDLLNADEDLGIDDIDTLEQFTLQKITTEWLNWNAQFFDYSDEPYLFYLAELLSKDFNKAQNSQRFALAPLPPSLPQPGVTKGPQKLGRFQPHLHSQLLNMLKNKKEGYLSNNSSSFNHFYNSLTSFTNKAKIQMGEVYSPFRTNANFTQDSLAPSFPPYGPPNGNRASLEMFFKEHMVFGENVSLKTKKQKLLQMFQQYKNFCSFNLTTHSVSNPFLPPLWVGGGNSQPEGGKGVEQHKKKIQNLLAILAQKNFSSKLTSTKNFAESSEKILGQRNLRREYNLEKNFSSSPPAAPFGRSEKGTGEKGGSQGAGSLDQSLSPLSVDRQSGRGVLLGSSDKKGLLKPGSLSSSGLGSLAKRGNRASLGTANSQSEFRDYYRKQTERALIEEESKKVFVIINSFGGSVGNGVTVHDALQFIKAGSLTLALGVAASAASLALAGGTIGERYVTEGCHVMIHQPESSLQGQASDIWIDSQEIMKIRLDVAEIYSLSTYRPRHKILRDLDRDFYLTATETIQYGLADEIATNEVLSEIIEMTSKVWDFHDSKQQRLLETRESASSGLDTQTQN